MTSRYFIEVAYDGRAYAGFQVQKNALTVQAAVEQSLTVILKQRIELTGSSRTDAGVHARSNFFHAEFPENWSPERVAGAVYNLNALLPPDIVIRSIRPVVSEAHARFSALYRRYNYRIYREKDPFNRGWGYYFPYRVQLEALQEAAAELKRTTDFQAFCKRNSQVHHYQCAVQKSYWREEGGILVYEVQANRFLRGMVRGMVGTMLRVGTGKLSREGFKAVIESKDCNQVDFSVPGCGLFLEEVGYPESIWQYRP